MNKWLKEIANQRFHATTKVIPFVRLEEEKLYLQPLPFPYQGKVARVALEDDSFWQGHDYKPLQHSLTVYQQILEAL